MTDTLIDEIKNLFSSAILIKSLFASVFVFFLGTHFGQSAFAKNNAPETEALYIVPTAPEFIEYSRFKIKIVKPYIDEQTQVIAYVFPEVLVGEADRIIEFQKVSGTLNQWDSPDAQAFCTITDDIFSCNIVLKKKISRLLNYVFRQAFAQNNSLDIKDSSIVSGIVNSIHRDKSLDHLEKMNLTAQDLQAFEHVVHSFFSNEPAGILSYEIR